MLNWLVAFKPKQVVRSGHVRAAAAALCTLTLEPDPPGHDDDVDAPSARQFACHALDAMSLGLPSKHVLGTVLEFVERYSRDGAADARIAALAVASCVVEGAAEGLRRHGGKGYALLRDVATGALGDSEDEVRRAAAVAILHLASHVQPEVADDADAILPPLLATLAAPELSERTRETVAGALDANLSNLGADTVEPILPQLMPPLMAVLETASADSHDTVLSTIASAAAASGGEAFAPYAQPLLGLLHRYVLLTSGSGLRLRAVATDCAGHVVQCLGKEAGKQLLPPFIQAAMQGFQLEDGLLKEYGHGLLSMAAELLQADFAPYLDAAVQLAFTSLAQVCDGRHKHVFVSIRILQSTLALEPSRAPCRTHVGAPGLCCHACCSCCGHHLSACDRHCLDLLLVKRATSQCTHSQARTPRLLHRNCTASCRKTLRLWQAVALKTRETALSTSLWAASRHCEYAETCCMHMCAMYGSVPALLALCMMQGVGAETMDVDNTCDTCICVQL